MGISAAGRHREVLRQPPHRQSDPSSRATQLPSEAAAPHAAATFADENVAKSRGLLVAPVCGPPNTGRAETLQPRSPNGDLRSDGEVNGHNGHAQT
eukprot:8962343-Pyramimonas_sp.AAC.1